MDDELRKEIIELININEEKDSIEIGNSKTGVVKIYCDFSKPDLATIKLTNAINILKNNRDLVFK